MQSQDEEKVNRAKEYLWSIIKELVEFPEEIKIDASLDAYGVNLAVIGRESDTRLLIGTKGYFAEAVRKIIKMWGYQNGATVNFVVKPGSMTNT